MPVDPMDDIELRSVQLQFSNGRGSLSGVCDIRRVVTDKGEVSVAIQGDTTKPAILTYHDLGLNCMYHSNENQKKKLNLFLLFYFSFKKHNYSDTFRCDRQIVVSMQ